MTPPRILVMCNHIDGLGGAERVSHAVAGGLARRGYEVSMIGVRPTSGAQVSLADLSYPTGFLSDRPEAPAGAAPLAPGIRREMRREALASLRRVLDEHRDGVVICAQVFTMEHIAEVGIEEVMAAGTRLVGQYHSSYEAARVSGDFARLSATYRQLDKFLLLTRSDADQFLQKNFNNTGVMPNPVSFLPASVPTAREQLLVAVARYDDVKQLDHALRAWSMVAPAHPDWRFELYGEGEDRARLEHLARELGIADSAQLMGVTDDVPGVLARAKLSVLCSRWEGLPMVLPESLASGVPPVTYDCSPGVREIVSDGVDGLVVRQDDVAGLAAALTSLMDDDARRQALAAAGRESVRRFAAEAVMDRWEDLLQRVMR